MFKLSRITDLPRRMLPARRLPGAGRPRPALPGPVARAAGADRDRAAGHPGRQGARAAPAGRAGEHRTLPLPGGFEVYCGRPTATCGTLAEEIVQLRGRRHRAGAGRVADRGSSGAWNARSPIDQAGRGVTSQAQVRRLLSLVPYLREHDGVPMTDGGGGVRHHRGDAARGPQRAVDVRHAGTDPGRPDRHRHGRRRRRRGDPPQQRRLPDPAAAAVGRRGAGAGARAADAARDRRSGQAGRGGPGPEEAGGGGRQRAAPPTRPRSR